jgi:hypothetical protein
MQMNNDQFINFSDLNEMPKNYGMTFFLRNGEKKSFEVVSHQYINDLRCFEVVTKEEEGRLIPMDVIAEIIFDKRWMKIIEMRNAISQQNKASKN